MTTTKQARILAFSGSARKDSFNQKLVTEAAAGAKEAGAVVTVVSLADFDMPILNEDWERENGKPEAAAKLKQLILEHDGLLISSPEYNSSISPLLKNAIDWVSRPDEGDAGRLIAYQGKVAGIMAASPGGLGGIRGLVHLRAILGNIGVMVVPNQIAISNAHEAFDSNGQITDAGKRDSVLGIGRRVATIAAATTE